MARVLLAVFLIASAAAAFAQEVPQAFDFPEAGLTVELPEGFHLAQILEEHFPAFVLFAFQDDRDAERVRLLHVQFHTYFDAAQRAAWLSGEEAERRLGHSDDLERVDPAAFPLAAGAVYRIGSARPGWYAYVLFGCDDDRCYRVDAVGPLGEGETPEEAFCALLRGVQFAAM